ncbi:MAG TPA: hypothetical protein VN745_07155, partial [Verrucomicrobiae bacterium]|nr:hypothetical protein [Verrucomicrobiae bacterium]
PVRMLPLLLFELTWKAIYLLAFALPMWRAHQITPAVASDIKSILMVIIIVPLIPWRFVFAHYIQKQTRPLAEGRVTAQNDFARPWFCFSSRVPRHKESQTAPSR